MAERLGAFLGEIGARSRALLREGRHRNALTLAIVFLAVSFLALSLAVVWVGVTWSRQQALEQAQRDKEITVTPESRAEDFPLMFGPGPSPELAEATSSSADDGRSRGIPGLSAMEVMAYLRNTSGTDFRCTGGRPTKRVCRSSTSEDPAVYEVAFLGNARATVAVVATAYDASEEEAAEVLGRVAELSLQNAAPIDARS